MANKSALAAAVALVGAGLAAAAAAQPVLKPPPPVTPNPATVHAISEASKGAPYPTFAQVPPLPKDVRSMAAWKASVTSVKTDGAHVAELAAAEPWTLGDTEGWAERTRAEATPPPPMTTPSTQADTEAFAAAMRARAMPPPRKR